MMYSLAPVANSARVAAWHMVDGIAPTPDRPPGMGGMTKIVHWVAWGAVLAALIGFLVGAGTIWMKHHRGETIANALRDIISPLIGLVIIGGAGGIIGALT
jgi:hypothetical protein